ncbi:(+)-cis,cis-nepetalactol synthase NEPS3-like [Diospyros lotus]|uniref:(+)-cis,cis-nepetalactol synthase NEPS3-like n=1 Tax=Diospyros lotus TaxID=55363 RepID=UPI00224CB35F|nr:(+)-cis,cis-nepetalactol synthase NEPS3-like [Diospyros lotus]
MADSALCKKRLEGKVAIITGGGSGIGEATARHFADHGARAVVIADIQEERGREVAASIGSHRCIFLKCDVTDEQQVKSLVDSTVQIFGRLDVMFSNVGILSSCEQNILDFDLDAYDHLMKTNVRGMAACVKHAGRAMVEAGVRGSIVCTASVVATIGAAVQIDYIMSKHAVLGLVRSASLGLGEHGVRVNCVSPGMVATPLVRGAFRKSAEELEKAFEPSICLKKSGPLRLKHVADAVLFLACDESEFITGHNLAVNGGFRPK